MSSRICSLDDRYYSALAAGHAHVARYSRETEVKMAARDQPSAIACPEAPQLCPSESAIEE
jgi:hypothetical protein